MFELLKERWNNGYIGIDTLMGWVELNKKNPEVGITQEQFNEITGYVGV